MKLFAQKEAEDFVKTGAKEFRYNREIRLTPGAKDVFTEASVKLVFDEGAIAPVAVAGGSGGGASSDAALFNSPAVNAIKDQICDMGRRMWIREFTDGNGGNISCKVAENRFLITPTGVSKGFLKPEMLCMVDIDGKQVAGTWKRSSEFPTHAAVYRSTPQAVAVCHGHPCYTGAFAIKGIQPPTRIISEAEVFIGTVAYTPYETPGTKEIADLIFPVAPKHMSILMGNHGLLCWGMSVEDAYFKMEITEAYCRTLIHAQSLPGGASIPGDKVQELLDIKKKMGLPDDRYGLKPAELCEVDPWVHMCGEHGTSSPVTPFNPMTLGTNMSPAELEALVQKLTEEILKNLDKK